MSKTNSQKQRSRLNLIKQIYSKLTTNTIAIPDLPIIMSAVTDLLDSKSLNNTQLAVWNKYVYPKNKSKKNKHKKFKKRVQSKNHPQGQKLDQKKPTIVIKKRPIVVIKK